MESIAKVNNDNVKNSEFYEKFEELRKRYASCLTEESPKPSSLATALAPIKDLATNKEYMMRLFFIMFPWIAVGTSSYGVHFSVKMVQFDIFTVAAVKECASVAVMVVSILLFSMVRKKAVHFLYDLTY